ncbi:uncharacterized protein LAESUDRAFT_137217 [Laetiporus sulphureus 93-53]|uniref:N-acetyltransferase domain-containing protein n=1 Tax=Laetiporus sulphureus 93-53 TaxID=1314785 RepID=A0A165ED91_9APHY|nr:uncharacterized protein LAESUDRAFT_137217 [Laetiporus sulphureus 93-53]KZT06784.1 hypothetical protein LAESUDRAFT_137217 [Laetiporus sulphureus 93-53]
MAHQKGPINRRTWEGELCAFQTSDSTWMDHEGKALLHGPKCKPLEYREIPYAVHASMLATKDDPLAHYLEDTPDAGLNRARKYRSKVGLYLTTGDGVRRHEVMTVGGGDSNIIYSHARDLVPRRRRLVNDAVQQVIQRFLRLLRITYTKQQLARHQEFREKFEPAVEEAIGKRANELFEINGLSTHPEKQGRGYASALVEHVTMLADKYSRGTWLLTNEYTTGFYARLGFATVKSIVLGEHDPTWTEGPVVVCIMLREPEAPASVYKDERSEVLSCDSGIV